jgi:BirA family biotin operon repressor/biotin-[acetyl-CoA-carboxylase] ligase
LALEVKSLIDQPAADLADAGAGRVARTDVLIAVLDALSQVLVEFDRGGFVPLRAEWMRHHAHQDRAVTLSSPDGARLHGVARGVDEHARLLLETESGVRTIHTGDVSLRAVR